MRKGRAPVYDLATVSGRKPRSRLRRMEDYGIIAVALTTPSIGGVAPRKGACRRKIEMSPCAQSRDDTPLGGRYDQRDTGSQPDTAFRIELRWSVTGEAEAGSAGEQPAEE